MSVDEVNTGVVSVDEVNTGVVSVDEVNTGVVSVDEVNTGVDVLLNTISIIDYARKILSEEQFNEIGEMWLNSIGMTIEKLDVLINCDLAIEQIIALGGENIAHELMTDQKLTVIGYMLSASDIKRIGAKKIAIMSIKELNSIV